MDDRREETWWRGLYRAFGYFGLFSVLGGILWGFRHDPAAPRENYLFNLGLYAAFATPHLVLTRSWMKSLLWGSPTGSPRERRVYIVVATFSWLAILLLHRSVPGPSVSAPDLVSLAGSIGFVFFAVAGFEGFHFATFDALLAVPGAPVAFSHGPETPLFTEGQFAQVRHPMYRAAVLASLCSFLIHPHAGQVFWCGLVGATLIGFIPIEESQLKAARRDDYLRYCEKTPYRLFRGVW